MQSRLNPSRRRQEKLRTRYGPWAVVTGASAGIGKAFATRLAEAGLHLALVARNAETLTALATELSARHGVEARVTAADLAQEGALDALAAATGDLDVGLAVLAAGFGTSGPFLQASWPEEVQMLHVNCLAALGLSLHFGKRFVHRGRGGLVLMGSIVGFQGTPYAAHYAATKAYVQSLAEALHLELAEGGVDVISSAPGPVQSGFADRAGMRLGAALGPAEVAQGTLDALLAGRGTAVPGFLSKLLTYSLLPLPRRVRVRIMGRIMRGMTKHRLAPEGSAPLGPRTGRW